MRIIGVIFIILGILAGLLGVRSYLRDDAYAKASTTVKAFVKSAEVKPMSGKAVGSIRLVLAFCETALRIHWNTVIPKPFPSTIHFLQWKN